MSNNNAFWGKWFGSLYKDGDKAFKLKKFANGHNRSGPHQTSYPANSPIALKAKKDKERHVKMGLPVIIHSWPAMERNGQKAT